MWRAALPALALLAAAPACAQDFYAGKQINFIVGAAAGGGYDLLGRLVARHMGRHIAGNPTITVQNMPAGGSLVAANLLYNTAPRDGLTIGLMQRGILLANVAGVTQAHFDIGKYNWLGSLNSEVGVTIAMASSGVTTTRDLFEKELVVGGVINADVETTPKLYNELLGTKFRIINGYNATGEIGLAMERGELQGIGDWSWSSLVSTQPAWFRDGRAKLLLQGSLIPSPELSHLPKALDFARGPLERKTLELYFTQKTVARPMLAPPGVPAERLAALRRGFDALIRDKDFLADAERSKIEVSLIASADVERVIGVITSADDATRARFASAMK